VKPGGEDTGVPFRLVRVARSLDNPWLYDLVQYAAGMRRVRERLRPHVASFAGERVLDVGAGTGLYRSILPDLDTYVALDIDPRKLERLRRRDADIQTVVGDASRLELADRSFDHALCTLLLHHLTDDQVRGLTAGLRKAVSRSLVLVDPLRVRGRLRSRLLWSIDRGSYQRTAEQLLDLLDRDFVIEHSEHFQVHHRYLLCVATPRPGD